MAIVTMDDDDVYEEEDSVQYLVDRNGSKIEETVVPDKNEYRTIEIVNSDKRLDKVVQYIEGEEWTVDYYLQLITEDNEIGPFDVDAPEASVQFALINKLILYVDTALNQDEAQNIAGSAYINAGVTPNQGDVFTATLLGKRRAVLRVETVEKKSYNLTNIFYISYKVDMFFDSKIELLDHLTKRVVKTYCYDKNFLETNSAPLLLENKYIEKRKVQVSIKEVIEYYFKNMFNEERHLLSIPGQQFTVVDLMLQEFIFRFINSTDSNYISRLQRISLPDEYLKQYTLWEALLNRDADILFRCNRKVTIVSTASFNNNIKLRSILYTGIQYLVYPNSPDLTIVETARRSTNSTIKLDSVPNPYRASKGTMDNLIPEYDPDDDFYVFTEAFYTNNRGKMTILESLIYQYLHNEAIDTLWLTYLVDDYKYWNRVQQYYYIPIIILLLRDSANRTSSIT